jgi:hypothetical protein
MGSFGVVIVVVLLVGHFGRKSELFVMRIFSLASAGATRQRPLLPEQIAGQID